MTWLDGLFILVLIVTLAVGARMGSLWTGACLAGGFFGAFLVDMYALPLSGILGHFPAATGVAGVLLFIGGCVALLVPGYLLSKISAGLFLGVIDSAFGLITGALAGLCALALLVILVVPLFPKVEKTHPWKNSVLVKPYHDFLEKLLSRPHFRLPSAGDLIREQALEKIAPAAAEAEADIKKAARRVVNDLKKK